MKIVFKLTEQLISVYFSCNMLILKDFKHVLGLPDPFAHFCYI